VTGRIAIAAPVARPPDAACHVVIESVDKPRAIYGASTLQALLLATRFLHTLLHAFVAGGGRVLYPETESDLSLDALFGNVALPP
jgi:hypothetical protein